MAWESRLAGKQLLSFRGRLMAWFRRNRRELPWRSRSAGRNPYRIWLAEIMLQQTRVAAAVPYYRRFLRRFPSVRALARARGEEVLRYWAGLGYYRRARNLHRAAKKVTRQHRGRFPRDLSKALALPGIGRYTASAVLSIACGAPLAVLDGNVARVLARLDAVRGDPTERDAPRRRQQLQQRAQQLLATTAPGDWNQAMMELGATVCTPQAPRCELCPVSRWCRAYRLGIAGQLPAPPKKPAPVRLRVAAAVLLDPRGRTLLLRPPGKLSRLFSSMWQFPAIEVARDAPGELAQHLQKELGLGSPELAALGETRHSVTFRRITLEPFLVRVARLPNIPHAHAVPLAELGGLPAAEGLPISNATRKIAGAALQQGNRKK